MHARESKPATNQAEAKTSTAPMRPSENATRMPAWAAALPIETGLTLAQPANFVSLKSTPAVQRREMPDNTPENQLQDSDWKISDRVYSRSRWEAANLYNLIGLRAHEYTQPHERRDFYLWFYNYTSKQGYETRWPLAAYLVASGASRLSYGSIYSNEIQVAARQGNQMIFDDVLPKMVDLIRRGPLRGAAAQAWDAQTLSEEQELVQHMYSSMSPGAITTFEGYAKQEGVLPTLGQIGGFTTPHRGGQYHRQQPVPGFTGDIRSVDDRFRYGMRLADLFSTHPAPAGGVSRPAARPEYTNGQAFNRLNVRMGLHRLDAELDDFDVDEEAVIIIMQALTADEQRELGFNRLRLDMLRNAMDQGEMRRALNGLPDVTAETRQYLQH